MSKKRNKRKVKNRNVICEMMILRTGSHAGTHKNKTLRGSGKVGGKAGRHAKHKKKIRYDE